MPDLPLHAGITGFVYEGLNIPVRYEAGGSEIAGYVRLGLSTEAITRKWKSTLATTIWATLLLVLLVAGLVYLPMRRILRPIEQLSNGALKIGRGDLDFRISVDRDDEIGQLAENFNNMAVSLSRQNEEISRKTVALELSERKFRQLFENIGQALYINSLDGRLLDCNQAMVDMFGYSGRSEMIEHVLSGDVLYAVSEQRQQVIDELLAKGEIKDREIEFRRRDGELIKTLVTSRVRLDDQGEPVGFEGIIQDVTEMRQLEEQLFQSQKMESIGTLAGGIAHDFNNLLTAILSSAEMARRRIEDRQSVEKHIDSIISASKRAAELTRNLLGFARKGKTRLEEIDIEDLLEEIRSLLRETIDRSIRIRTETGDNLRHVQGNPTQIHQIIVNLCINARDAILENSGSELRISAHNVVIDASFVEAHPEAECGSYVRIDVCDDGGGIPEEFRDRIFDPFFTTKGVGKGTGLGLATVYGIIKSHDGFLDLETETGVGTTFHIYLPAFGGESPVVGDLAIESLVSTGEVKQAGEARGAILLVDDEEILRVVAEEYLDSYGYRVLLAENGVEAEHILSEHHDQIDLVIADLVMPKMGGDELLRRVKHSYPCMPVIIVSGYSETVLQKKLSDQSYDGYLEKPYELSMLGVMVESLIKVEV